MPKGQPTPQGYVKWVLTLSPDDCATLDSLARSFRLEKTRAARLALRAFPRLVPPLAQVAIHVQAARQEILSEDYDDYILDQLHTPLAFLPEDILLRLQARAEKKGVSVVAELVSVLDGELNRGRKKPKREATTPVEAQPAPPPQSTSTLEYDPDDDVSSPAPATRCASCGGMFYARDAGERLCPACQRREMRGNDENE